MKLMPNTQLEYRELAVGESFHCNGNDYQKVDEQWATIIHRDADGWREKRFWFYPETLVDRSSSPRD